MYLKKITFILLFCISSINASCVSAHLLSVIERLTPDFIWNDPFIYRNKELIPISRFTDDPILLSMIKMNRNLSSFVKELDFLIYEDDYIYKKGKINRSQLSFIKTKMNSNLYPEFLPYFKGYTPYKFGNLVFIMDKNTNDIYINFKVDKNNILDLYKILVLSKYKVSESFIINSNNYIFNFVNADYSLGFLNTLPKYLYSSFSEFNGKSFLSFKLNIKNKHDIEMLKNIFYGIKIYNDGTLTSIEIDSLIKEYEISIPTFNF